MPILANCMRKSITFPFLKCPFEQVEGYTSPLPYILGIISLFAFLLHPLWMGLVRKGRLCPFPHAEEVSAMS